MEGDQCCQLSPELAADVSRVKAAVQSKSEDMLIKSKVTKVMQHVQRCTARFNQKPTTSEADNLCTSMYRDLVGSELREELLELCAALGVELHQPHTLLWMLYEYQISSFLRPGLPVDQTRMEDDVELSHSELQTLRYVGGFLVHKLRRRKCSVAQGVARELTDSTDGDQASSDSDDLLEFTKLFVNEMDRGGLTHITDNFFLFLREVEVVVKRSFQNVSETTAENLQSELFQNEVVRSLWEKAASEETEEIFKVVVKYFIDLRMKAYCKTLRFITEAKEKGKNRRSLRKSLS